MGQPNRNGSEKSAPTSQYIRRRSPVVSEKSSANLLILLSCIPAWGGGVQNGDSLSIFLAVELPAFGQGRMLTH